MGLVGHQWAIARAGLAPVVPLLELALGFGDEMDPDVLVALRGPLGGLCATAHRALGPEPAAQLEATIAAHFAPALDALGLKARARENDEVRLRRAALLAIVGGLCERPETVEAAAKLAAPTWRIARRSTRTSRTRPWRSPPPEATQPSTTAFSRRPRRRPTPTIAAASSWRWASSANPRW